MRLIFLVVLFSVIGCQSKPKLIKRQASLDIAQYKGTKVNGTASVSGQAFANLKNGEVKKASGRQVFLYPKREHSMEWYTVQVVQRQTLEPLDEKLGKLISYYSRTTVADAEGRFKFKNLPEDCYVAVSYIDWEYVWARTTFGTPINGKHVASVGAEFCLKKGEHKDILLKLDGAKF